MFPGASKIEEEQIKELSAILEREGQKDYKVDSILEEE